MALTETQTKSLKAKLKRRHVKTREAGGSSVSYVEGWHAIAEANRIFGFDSWDRQTLAPRCHWAHLQYRETVCFYSTKVRITVRAGDTVTVREGIGTGFGRAPQPEFAHDIALKAAETDATKRALATFGNPFGLALYDRGQAHVTKAREKVATDNKRSLQSPDLVLSDGDGKDVRFSDHEEFLNAALRQIESLESTDSLYAFWSRNSAAFGKLRIDSEHGDNLAKKLVDALKERARQVGQPASNGTTRRFRFSPRSDDGLLPHSKREALARPRASRLRRQRAVSCLRSPPSTSTSFKICAISRDGAEGLGRVYCSVVQHPSRRTASHRRRARLVGKKRDPRATEVCSATLGSVARSTQSDDSQWQRNPRSRFGIGVQRAVSAQGVRSGSAIDLIGPDRGACGT